MPAIINYTNLHINGAASIASSRGCCVNGASQVSATRVAYVYGASPAYSSNYSYVRGLASYLTPPRDCYIVTADTYVAPIIRSAVEFDRSQSQYGYFPHNRAYENLTQFTLNVWIKPISPLVASAHPAYLEKDYGGSQSIGIYQEPSAGKFHAGIDTGSWSAVNSTTVPVLGKWYMVSLRYTGSIFELYINGVLEGSFAKTGTVRISGDAWHIAYRPNTGHYMSMGIDKFKFWNYALEPSEINLFYKTPNICTTMASYVHIQEYHNLDDNLSAYIESDISFTNPLIAKSTISAAIANNAKHSAHNCYIAAGGDFSDYYDMKTDVQDRSALTLDTIIFVRGGQTHFPEYDTGQVLYPITRTATRPLTVYTQEIPGVDRSHQDCYIQKSIGIGSSIPAYIKVKETIRESRDVYIAGPYSDSTGDILCYISCPEVSSTNAFIDGTLVISQDSGLNACIVTDAIPFGVSTLMSHVVGPGDIVNIDCHIVVANTDTSAHSLFLHGDITYPIESPRYAYMFGAGQISRPRHCFIEGVFAEEFSKDCCIVTNDVEINSIGAIVMSSIPLKVLQRLHLMANAPITSSKPIYLHANLVVLEPKQSFIRGLGKFESARKGYVVGHIPTDVTKIAFTHGFISDSSAINAFIYNNTSSGATNCYINAVPTSTTSVAMHVMGVNLMEGSVPAYIVNVIIDNDISVSAFTAGFDKAYAIAPAYIPNVGVRHARRRMVYIV